MTNPAPSTPNRADLFTAREYLHLPFSEQPVGGTGDPDAVYDPYPPGPFPPGATVTATDNNNNPVLFWLYEPTLDESGTPTGEWVLTSSPTSTIDENGCLVAMLPYDVTITLHTDDRPLVEFRVAKPPRIVLREANPNMTRLLWHQQYGTPLAPPFS